MFNKLVLILIFLFIPLTINAGGIYPDYLYGDPNYKLVTGRMGYATYIDKSSATVMLATESDVIVSAIFIVYNVDKSIQETPRAVFFYINTNPNQTGYKKAYVNGYTMTLPPYAGKDYYYKSFDLGITWHKYPGVPKLGPEIRNLMSFKCVMDAIKEKHQNNKR